MNDSADLYTGDLASATWRKSSYTANNGNCVEVADMPNAPGIAVRDSKNTHLPAARVSHAAWSAFLAAVVDDTLSGGFG
ncbi:DUF397 domain-containing protein [Streptomyces sp. ME19-01-6]|uniref:DUF397 domain-containing protein n=1 Tax=Streptomyces sp. ME19-01-6 TaxID=3028686 RepID=UPI0029B721C3|nr:DUF397 domain-containing protein [Streptomyces sp. ME19-01-6]MDX3231280.1 DUF397 domain-containing protein [Streptomyces sp. ME19-01-6]